jgi:glucuronate isomerase
LLHPDRLFPAEPQTRAVARRLYEGVRDLPIVSPHGHTDPRWFAENAPFDNPAALFIVPDHYIYRMLYSQSVKLEDLGVRRLDGGPVEGEPRIIWRRFAERYHLFRGTPTRMWLDHAFESLFGFGARLNAANADVCYDAIDAAQKTDKFRPRALFERFNIETIATTESPLDALKWHAMIGDSDWKGRVITTYRPDPVVDPDFAGFRSNLRLFGELTGEDTRSWRAISTRTASAAPSSRASARPRPTTGTRAR